MSGIMSPVGAYNSVPKKIPTSSPKVVGKTTSSNESSESRLKDISVRSSLTNKPDDTINSFRYKI